MEMGVLTGKGQRKLSGVMEVSYITCMHTFVRRNWTMHLMPAHFTLCKSQLDKNKKKIL
jgi:hypothetical protein